MLTREAFRAASVAPPGTFTRGALRLLGKDVDRVEAASATKLRAGVSFALAGVRTKPTETNPDGVSRGALVRRCGRLHAFKIGHLFDMQPVCCRQRACPSCARARARQNATDVSRAMGARRLPGVHFVFATLTQPKRPRHEETPRQAVDRIVATWQSITNSRTRIGREFHRLFAGGLRTTETTWAARGDKHHNGGGEVEFSGYHAHLHVLLEVRAGVSRGEAIGWLLRHWLAACPGASQQSQCIRGARVQDVGQLCKYVTKPLEAASGSPAVMRELFAGLHGLRLLQAFGEWSARAEHTRASGEVVPARPSWRDLEGDDDDDDDDDGSDLPRWQGPEIGELLRAAKVRHEGTTDRVVFQGHVPGDEVMVSAAEAWAVIEQVVGARVRGGPAGAAANPQRRARPGPNRGAAAPPS